MVIFRKMIVNNFMSYGKKQEIPLYKQGVVQVGGENLDEPGSDSNQTGKSAIIEALGWGLFGKTIRKLRPDEVVNRFAKRNCFVKIVFSVKNALYKVIRYRKHSENSNKLRLWFGDKLISYRLDEETQKKLEEVLGFDYQVFCNSIIFGGTRLFAELTDAEQKKVLESFLHFEGFDKALDKAKAHISNLKERLRNLELAISKAEGRVEASKAKLEALKSAKETIGAEKRGKIARLRKELSLIEEPKFSEESLETIQSYLKKVSKESARLEQAVSGARNDLAKLRKQHENWTKLVGKPCPTCGQLITQKSSKDVKAHISDDRKALVTRLQDLKSKLEAAKKEEDYTEGIVKSLLEKREQRSQATVKVVRIEERIASVKRQLRSSSYFEEQFESYSRNYSRAMSKLFSLRRRKKLAEKQLEDFNFWAEGFGNKGIKALVIKRALPTMNSKLKEYVDEIFQGAAEVRFSSAKKKKTGEEQELFHIHYEAKRGTGRYPGESSGGKKRVGICVLLVFFWMSKASNILFVDELLDNLDETGREKVLEILSSLRQTVLVISHYKEFKSKVGASWTVVKRNGYSRILFEKEAA